MALPLPRRGSYGDLCAGSPPAPVPGGYRGVEGAVLEGAPLWTKKMAERVCESAPTEATIDGLGRRLFRCPSSDKWLSLNKEARKIVQQAKACLLTQALSPAERVSCINQAVAFEKLYEKTDAQLKKARCITWLFNWIQEKIWPISHMREDLAGAEKSFRAYDGHNLRWVFSCPFEAFAPIVTRSCEGDPETVADGTERYFVKDRVLRERAALCEDTDPLPRLE